MIMILTWLWWSNFGWTEDASSSISPLVIFTISTFFDFDFQVSLRPVANGKPSLLQARWDVDSELEWITSIINQNMWHTTFLPQLFWIVECSSWWQLSTTVLSSWMQASRWPMYQLWAVSKLEAQCNWPFLPSPGLCPHHHLDQTHHHHRPLSSPCPWVPSGLHPCLY